MRSETTPPGGTTADARVRNGGARLTPLMDVNIACVLLSGSVSAAWLLSVSQKPYVPSLFWTAVAPELISRNFRVCPTSVGAVNVTVCWPDPGTVVLTTFAMSFAFGKAGVTVMTAAGGGGGGG